MRFDSFHFLNVCATSQGRRKKNRVRVHIKFLESRIISFIKGSTKGNKALVYD